LYVPVAPGKIEVQESVDSIMPDAYIVAAQPLPVLSSGETPGAPIEVIWYSLMLFPGLQKVRVYGPGPFKQIGVPTEVMGPQLTW
jgi:hypothetical protein